MEYFVYVSLSSVILIDSSNWSHVQVLVSSIRGHPRLRAPGVVPFIISFSPGNSLFPRGLTTVC